MTDAILLGDPNALTSAFPPALRRAIGARVRLRNVAPDGLCAVPTPEDLAEARIILSTWGMPVLDAAFLAAAPRLQAVFYAAGSVKSFATEAARERGISICSAVEANAIPVAEYTLAMTLLSLKHVWASLREAPAERGRRLTQEPPGAYGATVGLISLGAVGRAAARLLADHDLHILAYDPITAPDAAAALGVEAVSLAEIFSRSDVVSIHAPRLPETEGMIGVHLVRSMKVNATLINTSRGALIDEEGLCTVLRERPDLTAILDVTDPEPPTPESSLRTLPNVLLTPHVAGSRGDEVSRMGWWMLQELERYLDGAPLKHQVEYAILARLA